VLQSTEKWLNPCHSDITRTVGSIVFSLIVDMLSILTVMNCLSDPKPPHLKPIDAKFH
jgi:hypothetical protein